MSAHPEQRAFADECAARAMQAMISNPNILQAATKGALLDRTCLDHIANEAWEISDAMCRAAEQRAAARLWGKHG